jgi:translation initiation factor IF-1
MAEAAKYTVAGAVVEMKPNLFCSVRLDTGEQVQARIPKHVARLMFRIVAGDRVLMESRSQEPYLVLGHERVSSEPR